MAKFKMNSEVLIGLDVDEEALKKAIGGNVEALWYAFTWCFTPQGHEHWESIYSGRRKMSKRSRRYLNKLLSA